MRASAKRHYSGHANPSVPGAGWRDFLALPRTSPIALSSRRTYHRLHITEEIMKSTRRAFLKSSIAAQAAAIGFPMVVTSPLRGASAPGNLINIGFIGTGRIARDHDMPGILKHEKLARITAICDLDSNRIEEGRQSVQERYAEKGISVTVRTYGDYREMLQNKELDAVVICTPDHWHAKPAIEAAQAGKDIYLEKPNSLTIAEGRAVSDAIMRTGRIFQMGTQQRSWEQFRVACELVRNGRIGKLHTVKIGLPGDPAGKPEPEMPVPRNLNYEMWLGSTPYVYYTENRVHPQKGYDRPGWLRCEQFGAGMITGWGQHHVDIAHWGMDAEYSGPTEISATAEFPKSGLWDVHGDFNVEALYPGGVTMMVSGKYPNGIRFEGSEGWIFVTRGDYSVTASDPTGSSAAQSPLTASNPAILRSQIGLDEIHLYKSTDHHGNWLECIRSRQPTICTVEIAHRACTACLLSHIAMKLPRRLYWDSIRERFRNDDEANRLLARAQRWPYQIGEVAP
jgi:myo-inositol 2-dehydrogenase/D-chiro-inositol 1-dehydrogenase